MQDSTLLRAREDAERLLESAIMRYGGLEIGVRAALEPGPIPLNYDHCFVRDFVPAALHFLIHGRVGIVRNFLLLVLEMQAHEQEKDPDRIGAGLLPASFRVRTDGAVDPDYGEEAIGRVTPVDSSLWWILLLRAFVRATGEDLAARPEVQAALRRVLGGLLLQRFELVPTLLVPDGSFMIDRRMGVGGHPLEIQALLVGALRAAAELLQTDDDEGRDHAHAVDERLHRLVRHLRSEYWLDLDRLNRIHRYRNDQFGEDAVNLFNVYPDAIPRWAVDWMPDGGGYLAGNVGPGLLDFRFFTLGNLLAALMGVLEDGGAAALMTVLRERERDLLGRMPLKICYPAVAGTAWRLVTGSDPKNTAWSYHNGGHWPVLLWALAAVAVRTDCGDLAREALRRAAARLPGDRWPEYYDGRQGRLVGKLARLEQVWSASGFLLAQDFVEDPEQVRRLFPDAALEARDLPRSGAGAPFRLGPGFPGS